MLPPEPDFRVPAEFEKQHAVWLGWATYENNRGWSSKSVQLELIRHMVSHVVVKIAVQNYVEQQSVEKLIREEGIPLHDVEFYRIPHPDLWFRDTGPIFQVTKDKQLRIVDFKFNTWGYRDSEDPYSKAEERVDRDIAKAMGLETVSTGVISEGGNRELNGKGVLLVSKSVEIQRNPRQSLKDLETEYRRLLGVTKIIWLEEGLIEDDSAFRTPIAGPTGKLEAYRPGGTGGHIDQYCRFVSPSTILLAEVSEEEAARHPIAMENRTRMETNFQILTNSTDQDGNPFNVMRMPLPYTMYDYLGPGDVMYQVVSKLEFEGGHKFPKSLI